jgi:hypothetical protein
MKTGMIAIAPMIKAPQKNEKCRAGTRQDDRHAPLKALPEADGLAAQMLERAVGGRRQPDGRRRDR